MVSKPVERAAANLTARAVKLPRCRRNSQARSEPPSVAQPAILEAFTKEERDRVQEFLARRVCHMRGRKLEEADWGTVYCAAKQIPYKGWSNLGIDISHGSLGVEHKMLCTHAPPSMLMGTTKMHPAATRSIRVGSLDRAPDDAMRDVLGQYADLLRVRMTTLAEFGTPDLRTGWLLWQRDLSEFLYFEEELLPPDPAAYDAKWKVSGRPSGRRKMSKNLWIYERGTGKKRYSVTTEAGAKIQPYFDIPSAGSGVYVFKVRGEDVGEDLVRTWVTRPTLERLELALGNLDPAAIESGVERALAVEGEAAGETQSDGIPLAEPLVLPRETYDALAASLPDADDDTRFSMVADRLT